jgi:hypothetical protein
MDSLDPDLDPDLQHWLGGRAYKGKDGICLF